MAYVYKIINTLNNKMYIVITTRDPKIRFEEHKRRAFQKNYYGYNYPIYNAIRKYGIENFIFEVIYKTDNEIEIYEKEQYYIQLYDTILNGYNISVGGEGHSKYPTELILKYWEEGKTCTEIANILGCQITTISNRLKGNGIDQEQIYSRLSQTNKKNNSNPILQFDLNNNLIKEWNSSVEIEKILGYNSSNIRSCCRGKIKTAYGYVWKRKNGG